MLLCEDLNDDLGRESETSLSTGCSEAAGWLHCAVVVGRANLPSVVTSTLLFASVEVDGVFWLGCDLKFLSLAEIEFLMVLSVDP